MGPAFLRLRLKGSRMATELPDWTGKVPYKRENGDLILTVHHILTEPTCPTVSLQWENTGERIFRADCDTLDEGVNAALAWARENVLAA